MMNQCKLKYIMVMMEIINNNKKIHVKIAKYLESI